MIPVPKEDRPYVVAYDSIVNFTFNGIKGYYCDLYFFETYEQANNWRLAGIFGG